MDKRCTPRPRVEESRDSGRRAFPLQMCEKGLKGGAPHLSASTHEWGRRGAGEARVVPAASAKRRGGAVRRWTSDQARRPAELSISISGGKATNQDFPSNGERSGMSSSSRISGVDRQRIVAGRGGCTGGVSVEVDLERHVGEGDSPVGGRRCRKPLPSSESRVV